MDGMQMTGAAKGAMEIPFDLVDIGGTIANGSFGEIFRGQMFEGEYGLNRTKVAFKQLRNSTDEDFDREVNTMRALDHSKILRLLGVTSRPDGIRYMIFEYMVNGSLDQWLEENGEIFGVVNDNKDITMLSLIDIGFQIAEGMAYLESKGIVHRDLAARNILLAADLRVKIADFGLSRNIEEPGYYTMGASSVYPLRWTAPESFQTGQFNLQSDVWSFGVLLWEMFSYGSLPYGDMDDSAIKKYVTDGNKLKIPDEMHNDMSVLMQDCWHLDPNQRPSFQTIFNTISTIIKGMLLFPFLQQWINWDKDSKTYLPREDIWNITELPANIREKWGLQNWSILVLSRWVTEIDD